MAKKIKVVVKLQAPGGQATPAKGIGPALGPHGASAAEFCKQFNDKTKDQPGMILPVVITVYQDRSFTFVIKTPPAAILIMKELGLTKGSAVPHKDKVGKITKAQLKKIAEIKMPDVNANDLEAAMKIVAGSARSMGVEVEI
ncbi:MAG: 50S ribosomal protein L11 [Spirochaetes bacterium GWF1_31_7]|nr:MAG: 50S ribosomal protein L11 [Spirochaetes bacterium GWE1_32_154]OHD47330.1 MAG: 50S ribosomal protein L11 [Spirochaetes bacterium GWE2_31_10]OHD53191.1 MAG: 50S ribosomal protein L11 [Spirochaetes bacterium GWF1_31_7]OHD78374.1 MAG: 50S ribosomal protein L11 [Spirochaetes bacterium RIFOXYB1_FULL_32_8]HBD95002.1 50S ribosomal protein L11 [Spirochaetia bacterium]